MTKANDIQPIRVLIIDPYPLTRYGLMALVHAQPEFTLVRAVATASAVTQQRNADLALVHHDAGTPHPAITIPWVPVHITDAPHRIVSAARRIAGISAGRQPMQPKHLTARELEVVALVATGYTDDEIANALFISVRTVRSHLDRIRVKTGQRRRAELTRWYLRRTGDPIGSA
jgi:DNA-binding NarL/FixJ family response regulator